MNYKSDAAKAIHFSFCCSIVKRTEMKVKFNRQQKWAYIEHGWLGMYTISHRWYWGYGKGLQYFRSCLTY